MHENLMRNYQGFWGLQTGSAIEELADFLSWNRNDWAEFEKWMDYLERKSKIEKDKKRRRALLQRIHGMRYRGVLKMKSMAGKAMVRLSDDAWRRAYALRIKNSTKKLPAALYCLVIYDIPESHQRVRYVFRKFLKECGFVQFQKSVWIIQKPVAASVANVVRDLNIRDWVTVVKGEVVRD